MTLYRTDVVSDIQIECTESWSFLGSNEKRHERLTLRCDSVLSNKFRAFRRHVGPRGLASRENPKDGPILPQLSARSFPEET